MKQALFDIAVAIGLALAIAAVTLALLNAPPDLRRWETLNVAEVRR